MKWFTTFISQSQSLYIPTDHKEGQEEEPVQEEKKQQQHPLDNSLTDNTWLFGFLPSDTLKCLTYDVFCSDTLNPLDYLTPMDMTSVLGPVDDHCFPFEISEIFSRKKLRLESNILVKDSVESMSGSDLSTKEEEICSKDVVQRGSVTLGEQSVLPITHYQPHFRRHKRTLVYEKHMSSFSTVTQNTSLNEGSSEIEEYDGEPFTEIQTQRTDTLSISEDCTNKDNLESKLRQRKDEYPDVKDMLFEFSDTNLESRLNNDINPCHKRDRSMNRKVQWKKMTPELFHEIYQWEKTQSRVKQCQIQSKFHVNRSTYYRWKKKYLIAHPEESDLFSTPNSE